MSYQVFSRKYRPQTFTELVGQGYVVNTLRNAIQLQRLAQAYLFVGPHGVGKTSVARVLAKALNCITGPTINPCGVCGSCIEIAESRSLDVLEIDGASNNGVENVRELREGVSFSPVRGPFKVYIIDEVHMLSSGAFNALLKTVEEPPSHVKFILATTEVHKMPPTIISRCQRFDLRRIPAQLITTHLKTIASREKIDVEEEALKAIAAAAEGSLRDAESMLDQAVAFCNNRVTESDVLSIFGLTSSHTIVDLSSLVLHRRTKEALELTADQADRGCSLSHLLESWIVWLRNVLIQQVTPDSSTHPAAQEQALCVQQGKLLELLDLLAEEQSRMKWAIDTQLQMDIAIIKAAHLLERASLDDVLTTLTALSGETTISHPPSTLSCSKRPEEKSAHLPSEGVPCVEKDGSDTTQQPSNAQVIWGTVVAEVMKQGSIKFRWLEEGRAISFEGNTLHVCFPRPFRAQFDSIFWADIQPILEKHLSKIRGVPTRLAVELLEGFSSHKEDILHHTQSPAAPQNPAAAFKDDPLIRKALEVFKGTLQDM
ncbi:DNA polymerase III subunit tau [Candidatus Xiphinematobacter sp. Idaho Grape]|uniref:DNA polymerase III subunit gamma/tau n=1 Tax=Candidatus Xiphinematobacter sp. Idaho Grape TaxID=1704307 RepID=UPI0007057C32|nr:DNA polymerase III subunit gamma/tau [Candidatus Xiphinematobacter sp. Idaho Grape]ALJ56633.1 DNA polymerase III subunit tau [Candidatus Xiphinematobacter sp. Idaho Grape]